MIDNLPKEERIKLLDLYCKGMGLLSGTPAFEANLKEINKILKKGGE